MALGPRVRRPGVLDLKRLDVRELAAADAVAVRPEALEPRRRSVGVEERGRDVVERAAFSDPLDGGVEVPAVSGAGPVREERAIHEHEGRVADGLAFVADGSPHVRDGVALAELVAVLIVLVPVGPILVLVLLS